MLRLFCCAPGPVCFRWGLLQMGLPVLVSFLCVASASQCNSDVGWISFLCVLVICFDVFSLCLVPMSRCNSDVGRITTHIMMQL